MGVQFQLQMSWQPSLLSHKRKTGPPLGLRNLGNSCYLNSVLQCLTYTPPLANFCLRNQHTSLCDSSDSERKRDCPFCILEKRIVRSLSLDLSLDAPLKIQSCLRIFAEHFRCGRQEDAHEFLRYVIDACHNTCLRLKKLRRNANGNGNAANVIGNGAATTTSTVVKEIFGGALQSQVKCLSCGTESNKVDEIMDISLDVLNSNSLKDALQKFFQPELLDGQNKYKCEICNKLVAARKQMSILQAPNVLVIQLKRFEGIFGGKIDKSIAFEEFLVLSSFMCKASQDPRPEYKLFGTIVHSGFSPESGHYYAYIKDAMGQWYCCNDSFVSLSTMQEVLSEKVYILFFSRTNQRPPLASSASNGMSPRDCNGREASKPPKTALRPKGAQLKLSKQSSWKNSSAIPKVDKVSPGPRMRFNINGSSNSKRAPATDNGNIAHRNPSLGSNGERTPATDNGKLTHRDESFGSNGQRTLATDFRKLAHTTQLLGSNGDTASATDNGKIPYKNQSVGLNGDPKDPISLENGEIAKTSLINRGPVDEDKNVDVVDGNNTQQSLLSRENGSVVSVRTELREDIGTRGSLTSGKVPDDSELDNSGPHGHSHVSGSKRNSQDSCILFAHDAQSRAEVEGLKEILKKEASSILRSCGWSDEVYSFMCSRKRLCAQKIGTAQNSCEVKKLLITDSKSTFLLQIPESLRGDLVSRIQSFSQK